MNTHAEINPDLQLVPLADLSISPINTRQEVPEEDIVAMARSIAINGLMQNLLGHEALEGLQVVAGGKRLRALQRIAEDPQAYGLPAPIDPVPIRVTGDDGVAQEWALSENEARSDPHPADQIRAYRDMARAGADPATIARAFAKTERHVRGRLKLAELPDIALTALKDGKIGLDEAKVLTLAEDAAQAERVLEEVTAGRLHPNSIRRELSDGRIAATDRRARFVGLDTYTAEGGKLTADLFSEASLLHDEALLNTLFGVKLARAAENVKEAEGWLWAEVIHESYLPHTWHDTHQRLFREPGELSEADTEEYDRLADLVNADAGDDRDEARLQEMQARLDGDYTDDQRAIGGVFVYVEGDGTLHVERAFQRKADSTDTTPDSDADSVEITRTKPKPPITAKGTEDLHRIATLAAQTAALDRSELLLDLLAFQMEAGLSAWQAPFNIAGTVQTIEPSETGEVTISERLLAETEIEGRTVSERFAAFQALGKKHRNTILARQMARTINAPFRNDAGRMVMALLEADMRRVWTPTAANFFGACSVPCLDAIWAEVLELEDNDTRRDEFGRQKKGDKAKALEELFSDASVQEAHGLSRAQVKRLDTWVPEEFRLGN